MFKDYYLILGVSSDATPEEIEKAFKDADKRINVHGIISKDFHDTQEAYYILSDPELKYLYDKELEVYNASRNYDNYTILNSKLADRVSSLQGDIAANAGKTSGCNPKIVNGCIWTFILIIIFMISTCLGMILKQRRHKSMRNHYSYVIPQTEKQCLRIITN